MKQIEGVREVLQVSGDRRVLIRLNSRDNRSLEDTVYRELVPMGLEDVEVRIVLDSVASQPMV
jgi:DNA-binding Lrp family transcriptional regulator